MDNEQRGPGQKNASYRGMDWSVSIRGSQVRQLVDAPAAQHRQYALAGRTQQEPDGSVSFLASAAQVAAWQAEASQTGRSFDQILRYHLVTGVEVQGPDGLVLTMTLQPQGDE